MKIRTDFVTNSSSSSFCVSLRAELADGNALRFARFRDSGDCLYEGESFTVTDENGKEIISDFASPNYEEIFDKDNLETLVGRIGSIDLKRILESDDVETLIRRISFFGRSDFDIQFYIIDEHSLGPHDKLIKIEDGEMLIERKEGGRNRRYYICMTSESDKRVLVQYASEYNQMKDNCFKFMDEHIKSISDVKKLAVIYSFGGRGEDLAGPVEIIERVSGADRECVSLRGVLENDDPDTAFKLLKEMELFKNVDDESIKGFISFVKECEYYPNECTVVNTVNEDGTLHYEIDYSIWDI
ncbi:MAG: hypothetical protein J5715_02310 [Clostridiales bacterium]|nr:hypothetical protein [Clostridiales bacterium]